MQEFNGKTALITGASSGLGADFARRLAQSGANLVLVARRLKRMQELKREILASHPVDIEIIKLDLGVPGAAQKLFDQLHPKPIEILINNAGFGVYGNFLKQDLQRQRDMLALNMITLTELSHLFGAEMAKRGNGYILQVASLAGYQAMPNYAAYSAAKSYVLLLGEALHHELKPKGVTCTVLSPGITATEFFEVSGQTPSKNNRAIMMSSSDVVQIGLSTLLAGKQSVVPGFANKVMCLATRFVSRSLTARVSYLLMKNR